MNRTKIEWTQFTWNPVVGCTGLGCAVVKVCYARKMAKRQKHRCLKCYTFTPHMHKERLLEPLQRKTPSLIFAVSMGDLFGVPDWMTREVLKVMEKASWHTFQILTKQAHNLPRFSYPRNVWVGVTVNQQDDVWRLDFLKKTDAKIRFVSFEPLYSAISYDLSWLDWVIIGAQTRPEKQPKLEWIQGIFEACRGIPIFIKNNLACPAVWSFPVGRWRMSSSGRPELQR